MTDRIQAMRISTILPVLFCRKICIFDIGTMHSPIMPGLLCG